MHPLTCAQGSGCDFSWLLAAERGNMRERRYKAGKDLVATAIEESSLVAGKTVGQAPPASLVVVLEKWKFPMVVLVVFQW